MAKQFLTLLFFLFFSFFLKASFRGSPESLEQALDKTEAYEVFYTSNEPGEPIEGGVKAYLVNGYFSSLFSRLARSFGKKVLDKRSESYLRRGLRYLEGFYFSSLKKALDAFSIPWEVVPVNTELPLGHPHKEPVHKVKRRLSQESKKTLVFGHSKGGILGCEFAERLQADFVVSIFSPFGGASVAWVFSFVSLNVFPGGFSWGFEPVMAWAEEFLEVSRQAMQDMSVGAASLERAIASWPAERTLSVVGSLSMDKALYTHPLRPRLSWLGAFAPRVPFGVMGLLHGGFKGLFPQHDGLLTVDQQKRPGAPFVHLGASDHVSPSLTDFSPYAYKDWVRIYKALIRLVLQLEERVD